MNPQRPMMKGEMAWHGLTLDALAQELRSDLEVGLARGETERRLAVFGPNELPEAPPASPLRLLLAQFESLIVWVLVGAAVIAGLLADWVDTAAILAIVFLNALLGFVQEFRAERSLAALKKLSTTTARVVRDGSVRSIPSRELVPGDLMLLEAGDHVPADGWLVQASALRTQEAALTGESTPVDKTAEVLVKTETEIGDRHNMVFLGTNVTAGKGRALVVATGTRTELGRIAALMQRTSPEPTPLQRRLEQLGYVLLYLTFGIVALVFVLGLLRGEPLVSMFLTSVSLAVAAIPEGLPAIVTITLALGVTRMVKRHALIRRLPAVETLGSTTVICTDKTGTLTKNEMTVTRLFVGGRTYEVTGEGYAPVGEIRRADGRWRMAEKREEGEGLRQLLTAAVLCNGATLRQEGNHWRVLGDPTEGALLVVAAKLGLSKEKLEADQPFAGEVPFDSERKMMTVVRQLSGGKVAHVKGAPDVLLQRCTTRLTDDGQIEPLSELLRRQILEANSAFARDALRVLGLASKPLGQDLSAYRAADLERDLVFLGLAAMKDPARPETKVAIQACREAGIRVVMITGDHKDTAVAIARELGLLESEDQAMSGTELDRETDVGLAKRVASLTVYARVSAEHKLRVVRAWKSRGSIIAMTGDGVNDAPAVKEADIGIAMGLTGTDVTKEASDMVITDDNFASIGAAVEEGRAIYENIRKSVHYLLSCNLSEVLLMLLATLFALPLPLLPAQILWINLVTDGFPSLALAVDPKSPDLMRQPPRPPSERFLTRERMLLMFGQGSFIALMAVLVFVYSLYSMDKDLERARTVTFTVLVMAQLSHAFNCRSQRHSLFALGLWTNTRLLWAVAGSAALQAVIILNPWTQEVFKAVPLNPEHWALAFGVGVLPLVGMEALKAFWRWRQRV